MGYWLADKRTGQHSSFIQRFDPRFWTINFPRPMMASVVTTAPDALRVDAVFYNSDDLAGLIWESEDALDHPLLAYETERDYAGLIWRFRWRSSGIMPLDAINGPTLTIEGRDAAGNPKSWYVRLWNYASGTPTDALISIEFSPLDGGFVLPGEADPLFAEDIDRLFISIIPPDYDALGTRFATPRIGWVEISNIRTDGRGAVLDIGDIMLPGHGLAMATAYDDSFNQTPERLLRAIRALGYRGSINHYLGMSHYFRLETVGSGLYVSLSAPQAGEDFAAINQPTAAWHRDLIMRAETMGFTVIMSLSYELFDAHCWNDWKQRAENGDPALTGWEPPSTLLSPANGSAMSYLQAVARAFTAIARDAGATIRFQVGEPWWWIMPDKRICLYDAAASAAFGENSVSISSIDGPKTAAQQAMLDQAGALLAQSTADLLNAVKNEAGAAPVETLLLAYLPTILDEQAPEAKRANLPVGWASPAFDILQLEDYDWVIAGNRLATSTGVALATQRLGYPVEQQHYFAGFVLDAADQFIWGHMAQAIADAKVRGTAEIHIWALPQVARDGFTYFQEEEADVNAFDDVLFPIAIGQGASVSPGFSTNIITTISGHEKRNSDWADARLEFDVGPGIRSEEELHDLITFFRARRGAAKAFRFRDPYDHSSNGMIGAPTPNDQWLGEGDGQQTAFQLVKNYGDAAVEPQQRLITRPRQDSLQIAIDGQVAAGWTLGPAGSVFFDSPPANGSAITAGFLFDVPVRFARDQLTVSRATFLAGDIAEVLLVEVREPS
ncbi:MAG: TIGR02217 family protein [Sphingopyxis sp.]|nr:MAG: TIGR02217 family protein [Sphingopyxis sp.]